MKTCKDGSIGKNLRETLALRDKNPHGAAFDLLIEWEKALGTVDFQEKEQHLVQFREIVRFTAVTGIFCNYLPGCPVHQTTCRCAGR